MRQLASYVNGAWFRGSGSAQTLVNPSTEEPIAETSTAGIDFASVVDYARHKGGPALRELTFAERGALLDAMAKAISTGREELIALALENGGNTRGDAKFDIDGAGVTLAYYAELGRSLGDTRVIVDGDGEQVGRTARLYGQHILTPRQGVAVHINAFNFPAWGLAEKAAVALLAGMPVVSKPATATAVVAHRMMELFVEAKILPDGALSFLCGGVGDLLTHLRGQDVLAFTGSSDTAMKLRSGESVLSHSVHVNIEADSLNAAVLGPDVEPGSETEQLFFADVVRDITQKTGQKCTAIRRVYVPAKRAAAVGEELAARLREIVVGDPATEGVRMGPLATAQQLRDVRSGIARLAEATKEVMGGSGDISAKSVPAGKGYFCGPVLRHTDDPASCAPLNEHEVFGPVATIGSYSGSAKDAARLVQLGAGGLVASVYSDERAFLTEIVPALAAFHGRLYLGSAKMASQSPGPGTVLPMLTHGGPGHAGGGEELGGVRGMALYQQRTALQGDKGILKKLIE